MATQVYQLSGGGFSSLPNPTVLSPRSPTTNDTISSSGNPYQIGQYWQNTILNLLFLYEGRGVWVQIDMNPLGDFPITPFVVGPIGQAGYQTIQSALNAAAANSTAAYIFLQPGNYTENLIFPNIPITLGGDRGLLATVVGQHTPSATANLELTQLLLISSTDILNSSASGTSSIEISSSFILVTDGYVFDLPNWTGELLMDDCGEASTNDGVVNNTAGVTIKFLNTEMGAGTSKTMTLTGNGNLRFDTCNVNCPVNIAGSGTFLTQNGCVFRNNVTIGGSKTSTIIETVFITGSNAAITYSSSGTGYISGVTVNSSNNPAIAGSGSGTLTLGNINFISNIALSGSLTLAYIPAQLVASIINLGTALVTSGSGAPMLSAPQGSLYLRTDGSSSSTRAYINSNGSTGWIAVTTAS